MTPRRKRLYAVGALLVGVAAAALLAKQALKDNLSYFYDPTQVATGSAPRDHAIRVGGMVTKGSVERTPGSLDVRFAVTDFRSTVTVRYTGVLPDLFREGQGIIAHGKLGSDGVFVADEVLAKHDEKYTPPDVQKSLKAPSGSTT